MSLLWHLVWHCKSLNLDVLAALEADIQNYQPNTGRFSWYMKHHTSLSPTFNTKIGHENKNLAQSRIFDKNSLSPRLCLIWQRLLWSHNLQQKLAARFPLHQLTLFGKNGEASDNLDASKRASFLFCMKPTPPTSDFVLLDARYWNW